MNSDGAGYQPFDISGHWRQRAWSRTGQLAAVRSVDGKPEVFLIDLLTGSARQLTSAGASSPSWSPDGRRLAVVHRGWVDLIASSGGRPKRLTRGRAPAWAPNGKQLAFVGARDRLSVITLNGRQSKPVGHIRAVRVDWQPIPGAPPRRCQAPAGSRILAATPEATVTIDGLAVLGCLYSNGRERLLESLSASTEEGAPGVGSVAIAGDYAALVNELTDLHYYPTGSDNSVAVFDLRTGGPALDGADGESADCSICSSGIDELVLGSDGATAAHTFVLDDPMVYPWCQSTERIVANDSTGTRILDSITTTTTCDSPAPALLLSGLSLSGHTLTWLHAGIPHSAQLN